MTTTPLPRRAKFIYGFGDLGFSLSLTILGAYFAAAREAEAMAGYEREDAAMRALSRLSNADAEPILTRTTAVGPLMRRHLEPLFQPLLQHIRVLRGIV